MSEGIAQKRYEDLKRHRDPYLRRARDASRLTLPTLIPEEDTSNGQYDFKTPYQSIGARGVNNLASKIILTIMPPNSSSFRLSPDEKVLAEFEEAGEEDLRNQVEAALSKQERLVTKKIEADGDRVTAMEMAKHLLVSGNVLLDMRQPTLRLFGLGSYVCRRDPRGNLLEAITKESVAKETLPEEIRQMIREGEQDGSVGGNDSKAVDVYTSFKLEKDGKFHVFQEVQGKQVPGSQGDYTKENLPMLALRFTKVDGENYGRGFVEEYLGDLNSLEHLVEAIVMGSLASAKLIFLVHPNGTTDVADLNEAYNGDFISGSRDEVSALQVEKMADLRVAMETATRIEERLSFAFLLNTAVQRAGERVTAEEIRIMVGELEQSLGGIYSILTTEFQLPYIKRKMKATEGLPPLPEGMVEPIIITGLDALGRGQDLRKLDLFIAGANQTVGPEAMAQYLDIAGYLTRRATAIGIEPIGLVRSEEAVQAAQEKQQQQALMQQIAPQGVGAVGKIASQGVQAAIENQQQQAQSEQGINPNG